MRRIEAELTLIPDAEGKYDTSKANKLRGWVRSSAVILVLGADILSCPLAEAKPAARDKTEIDQLLITFMLPENASYNVLDWNTGSSGQNAILWRHPGIKDCPKHIEDQYAFCRLGDAILTNRGKVTHTRLRKFVEPGRWEVALMGARSGVSAVSISSGISSQELEPVALRANLQQSSRLRVTSLKQCGGASEGVELMRLVASGKKPAYLTQEWTCGSGGCGISLHLALDEVDARDVLRAACEP
jgi:hypothetical protein